MAIPHTNITPIPLSPLQAAVPELWNDRYDEIDDNFAAVVAGPASSTDNAVARFDSTSGVIIQNSTATISDAGSVNIAAGQNYLVNGAQHTHLTRTNKTHVDSPVTLTAQDVAGFKLFTNAGATSEVVMNLPAGADGYRITAIITAAYDFAFVANGTETIRYLSTVSKAGGSIKSSSIGDEVQMDWNGTQWVASLSGTGWHLETS